MKPADPAGPAPRTAIPERVRALVRRRDVWLVALAVGIGFGAGAGVVALGRAAQWAHELLFGLDDGARLSAADRIPWRAALAVPCLGGLALGALTWALARWRPVRPVDPIEANALRGGQMSVRGSLVVVGQTLLSNGVGASVGLEAAYTQLGSVLASRLGAAFRLRRADMRLLVGCGSAAAISAAFGAPLTGAFYGFEIVIAAYTPAMLAPVTAAAIAAYVASEALGGPPYAITAEPIALLSLDTMVALALLGLVCAGAAVLIMQAVTYAERGFRLTRIPAPFLPAVGGLMVGGLAVVSPRVLAAGHGAFEEVITRQEWSALALGSLIGLKVLASSVSLGSGFRGGLFFASLLLGSLLGRFSAAVAGMAVPVTMLDANVAALAGMAALAAGIVGGPLTMTFLILELTHDFAATVAVLVAVVVAWTVVRSTFGYSFATWRFHVRGEAIRSAQDVGWMDALTAGRLMRREPPRVPRDMTLARFRALHPLGSAARVVVVEPGTDTYAGLVGVPEAHRAELDAEADTREIGTLLGHAGDVLLPAMNIAEVARLFESTESEALAVVDGPVGRRVVGLLTEAHALRRYAEELDKARRDLSGEG